VPTQACKSRLRQDCVSSSTIPPRWVHDFGNFNFGVMMDAAGFPKATALAIAQAISISQGQGLDEVASQNDISLGYSWYDSYYSPN
jgi:hypothetical protein